MSGCAPSEAVTHCPRCSSSSDDIPGQMLFDFMACNCNWPDCKECASC